jgi:hypothetical protein
MVSRYVLSRPRHSTQLHRTEHTTTVSEPVNYGYGGVCSNKVTDTMVLKGSTSGVHFLIKHYEIILMLSVE